MTPVGPPEEARLVAMEPEAVAEQAPPERGAEYGVIVCAASDLAPADLRACFAIVGEGGAVRKAPMKQDLQRAELVAIARFGNEIVGVGAIKPVRKQYAKGIATKSCVSFPEDTAELGYVAVHPSHQGKGLSHRLTELLLSQHTGRLFATTDSARMKETLTAAGFTTKGKEWQGNRGLLSYWERGQRNRDGLAPSGERCQRIHSRWAFKGKNNGYRRPLS